MIVHLLRRLVIPFASLRASSEAKPKDLGFKTQILRRRSALSEAEGAPQNDKPLSIPIKLDDQ